MSRYMDFDPHCIRERNEQMLREGSTAGLERRPRRTAEGAGFSIHRPLPEGPHALGELPLKDSIMRPYHLFYRIVVVPQQKSYRFLTTP